MGLFLNSFAKKSSTFSVEEVRYSEELFNAFFEAVKDQPRTIFSVTSRLDLTFPFSKQRSESSANGLSKNTTKKSKHRQENDLIPCEQMKNLFKRRASQQAKRKMST